MYVYMYILINIIKNKKGFFEIWKSISQEIIEKVKVLKDKNPEYEILVTGHSLGGSLANFAALELTE